MKSYTEISLQSKIFLMNLLFSPSKSLSRAHLIQFFLALPIVFYVYCAKAQDSEGTHTRIHNQYQNLQALGMGNAYSAVTKDYTALFYNPAGLALIDNTQLNLSLGAGAAIDWLNFSSDNSKLNTTGTESQKFQAYQDLLSKYYGKVLSFRVQGPQGVLARPGWALGVIPLEVSFESKIHNQVSPALNTRLYADTTVAYGFASDIKSQEIPGRLYWGVTGKFINRGFYNKQFSAFDLAADSNVFKSSDLREGYTLDADLGLLYKPFTSDGFWSYFAAARPSLSMVVRNAVDSGFKSSLKLINKIPGEAPEKLFRRLDLGAKFEFPQLGIFGGRAAFEVKDLMHPQYSMKKSLHAGLELDWSMASWWKGHYRFGLNQGYVTAGLSALFLWFNLDVATWGEEVGTASSPQENRNYALNLNLDF